MPTIVLQEKWKHLLSSGLLDHLSLLGYFLLLCMWRRGYGSEKGVQYANVMYFDHVYTLTFVYRPIVIIYKRFVALLMKYIVPYGLKPQQISKHTISLLYIERPQCWGISCLKPFNLLFCKRLKECNPHSFAQSRGTDIPQGDSKEISHKCTNSQ